MFGYFGSKLAAEWIVADSGLPFTTLRATQFHDLILTMARQMAKLPVIPAPAGFQYRPIDAAEVAARLVELTLDKPAGRRTWVGRGRTAYPTCSGATCEPRTATAPSCRSSCQARLPTRSGPAPIWYPSGRWVAGREMSSWPRG